MLYKIRRLSFFISYDLAQVNNLNREIFLVYISLVTKKSLLVPIPPPD